MRLLIVPFVLAALLVHASAPAWGNNQEAAEKIASAIGANFPDADIDVAYQGGQVWLKGNAVSAEQRTGIMNQVRNVSGITVTSVNNDIQVVSPRAAIIGVPTRTPTQMPRPAVSALTNPPPIPNLTQITPASANPAPASPARTAPIPVSPAPVNLAQTNPVAASPAAVNSAPTNSMPAVPRSANPALASPAVGVPAPIIATSDRQPPPPPPHQEIVPMRPQLAPPQLVQSQPQMYGQTIAPHPQVAAVMTGADLAPYPLQHYPAAYGLQPGQQPVHPYPYPYMPTSYIPVGPEHMAYGQMAYGQMPQGQMAQGQPAHGQPMPMQSHAPHHQPPAYYGPQGPLPGQYNQPNLPDYAWPSYANYPNYAQVSYPRSYSPKAWPYIGPFYPYPQVPMEWRKVTLEHSNGWWWLDFNDGSPSGPFSALFRHPQQYRY